MADLKWRRLSRCIGYYDLITGILLLVAGIGFLTWGLKVGNITFKRDSTNIILMGVAIGAAVALKMVLSILLLRATRSDAEPKQALKRAVHWYCISISLIPCFMLFELLTALVTVAIVRGGFVVVICKYIEELERVCQSSAPQTEV